MLEGGFQSLTYQAPGGSINISSFSEAIKNINGADHVSINQGENHAGYTINVMWQISRRDMLKEAKDERGLWELLCRKMRRQPQTEKEQDMERRLEDMRMQLQQAYSLRDKGPVETLWDRVENFRLVV